MGTPEAQALIDAVAFEWGIDIDMRTVPDAVNPNRQRRVQARILTKTTPDALVEFQAMRDAMKAPGPQDDPEPILVEPPVEVVIDPAPTPAPEPTDGESPA